MKIKEYEDGGKGLWCLSVSQNQITEVCICFTLVNVLKYLKNVEGSTMNDYM